MPNCYYYDEQRNHCNCYVNENLNELLAENAKLREELEAAKHDLQVFSMGSVQLESENAKLREQMERLVTLLRVDCDIDASWDGLRRFWSIELTEGGCLMRDRACKAEAENDKLRELVEDMHAALQAFCDAQDVHGDNCPLWVERTDDCELRGIERRMSELRVEVDE